MNAVDTNVLLYSVDRDEPAGLGERFSLSHWDSMILGACQSAGATRLYTQDIGAPQTIDGIELANPFM